MAKKLTRPKPAVARSKRSVASKPASSKAAPSKVAKAKPAARKAAPVARKATPKPPASAAPKAAKPRAVAASKPVAPPPAAQPAPKAKRLRPEPINHVEQRAIPQRVTTAETTRRAKNAAGLSQKELEVFRQQLLEKRRELVGDLSSMEREALRSATGTNLSSLPMHMAEMGTDNYEQEFTLDLVEKDRQLLREINEALAKIIRGDYGICEGTGKPIAKARLEAQPWAKHSIDYARMVEQKRHGRRYPALDSAR